MSELTELQFKCNHVYGPWQYEGETHNDTDHYSRICPLCLHVQNHSGKMPPADWKPEPQIIANPKPLVTLSERMGFLVNVATAVARVGHGAQIVYIAGKVTGLPEREVKMKFARRKRLLQTMGFVVLNPCDFISINEDWQTAMRMATTLLMMADHINLLPDWQDSKGARAEFEMAATFGINVMNID